MKTRWQLLIVLTLMMSACTEPAIEFPKVARASRVVVKDRSGKTFEIAEADRVHAIVDFIDARRDRWEQPWYGVPVGRVHLSIYNGDEFKGTLGIGKNFFDCQRYGRFASRSASDGEVSEFLQLLGLSPETLR